MEAKEVAAGVNRDRATGRYVDSLEALCACGHGLGSHTSARVAGEQPCLSLDCECESFHKVKGEVK